MKFEKLDLPMINETAKCRNMNIEDVDRIFFSDPSDRDAFKEARAICSSCSESSKCLPYALTHPELEGIWAGTSKRMRERMRTKMRKSNVVQ